MIFRFFLSRFIRTHRIYDFRFAICDAFMGFLRPYAGLHTIFDALFFFLRANRVRGYSPLEFAGPLRPGGAAVLAVTPFLVR